MEPIDLVTGTAALWWERSPYSHYANTFCFMDTAAIGGSSEISFIGRNLRGGIRNGSD
jgi:hypothetical protein